MTNLNKREASLTAGEFWEEVKRKIGRMIVGTICLLSAIYTEKVYGIETVRNGAFYVTLILIFLDYLRLDFKVSFFFYDWLLVRPSEKVGLHGSTLALIGSTFTFAYFDFDIAIAALAMYVYGDALAALIGRTFGKTIIYENKSLEGSLVMFAVSLIAGLFLIKNIYLIMGMAIFAALIELLVVRLPDDLLLPLYTAMVGQIIGIALGRCAFNMGLIVALAVWLVGISAMVIFFLILQIFKKLRG